MPRAGPRPNAGRKARNESGQSLANSETICTWLPMRTWQRECAKLAS